MKHHEQDNEQVFPELRDRAGRLVLDNKGQHGSHGQAVLSISTKIGCSGHPLNDWVKKVENDEPHIGRGT